MSKGRLEAFSDGVLANITIMVLPRFAGPRYNGQQMTEAIARDPPICDGSP